MNLTCQLGETVQKVITTIGLFIYITSCQYRFTSIPLDSTKPKSMAIAAIYDTTNISLPHQILWERIQKELILKSNYNLTPPPQANFYLTAHIKKSEMNQINSYTNIRKKDPTSLVNPETQKPYTLSDFNRINIAASFSRQQALSITVEITVWDLQTKGVIFKKSYSSSGQYDIYSGSRPPESFLTRNVENKQYLFADLSENIVSQLIIDLNNL